MDKQKDIQEFVGSIVKVHGLTPEHRPFAYDLPLVPQDIKEGRFDPSENTNSVFRQTLQHVMDIQKKNYPDLDIPLIVQTLCKTIRQLDGPRTEGIFRVACKPEKLAELRAAYDGNKYDTKVTDPHVATGLLKEWLRELAEPVFPTQLYAACVDAVKDPETSPKEEMTKKVQELFCQAPVLSQRVIKHVTHLMHEIVNEDNCKINKMSLDSLAIVMAPSFLRCPNEDPMELLSNSKYETRFTLLLFQSIRH